MIAPRPGLSQSTRPYPGCHGSVQVLVRPDVGDAGAAGEFRVVAEGASGEVVRARGAFEAGVTAGGEEDRRRGVGVDDQEGVGEFEPGEIQEVVELAERGAVRDAVGRGRQKDPAAGVLKRPHQPGASLPVDFLVELKRRPVEKALFRRRGDLRRRRDGQDEVEEDEAGPAVGHCITV